MWFINIGNTDIFHLFYMFIIYSFAGWIMETVLVSVQSKEFVNRGFMNGPFCPIYGTGALAVYLFLTPVQDNIFLVIILGAIIATIIEYFTSLIMEKLFNAKWWDYSDKKFNLQGRICLSISVCWGFLSAFMLKILQPLSLKLIDSIPKTLGEFLGTIITAYFISDIVLTIFNILSINSKLEAISNIRKEFHEKLEEIPKFNKKQEFLDKLDKFKANNIKNPEYFTDFKFYIENEIKNYYNEKHEFYMEKRENIENTINELKNKLDKHKEYLKRTNSVEKRIIKAFPNIKSIKFSDDMSELKEYLRNKRRR